MLNTLKKAVFGSYISCIEPLPLRRGKGFLARVLKAVYGRATYDIRGIRLELDPVSLIDRRLLSGEGHDNFLLELIQDCLKDGGTFVDIGANTGYFSLLAARLPNVDVLAFEPSPRELKRFYRNLEINDLKGRVTVFPYGLSDQDHQIEFHLSHDANPGMNSVLDLSKECAYVRTIACRFLPFDLLVSPARLNQVRLCKVDVEGYEVSVLQGMAKSMCSMSHAVFVIEISPEFLEQKGQHPGEIYDFFAVHGFSPRFGLKKDAYQYDEIFEKTLP